MAAGTLSRVREMHGSSHRHHQYPGRNCCAVAPSRLARQSEYWRYRRPRNATHHSPGVRFIHHFHLHAGSPCACTEQPSRPQRAAHSQQAPDCVHGQSPCPPGAAVSHHLSSVASSCRCSGRSGAAASGAARLHRPPLRWFTRNTIEASVNAPGPVHGAQLFCVTDRVSPSRDPQMTNNPRPWSMARSWW